uniref:DUF5641 domain-containing protein n=1 Tax=Plectus sambesii TaxID=2011161 RepID=A0A914XLL5_9BILA
MEVEGEEEYKPDGPNSQDKLIKVWNKTLRTLDRFWTLWRSDYLTSLRERQQRFHQEPRSRARYTPQAGEVVLIRDDIVPRGLWRLGKVEEVTTSSDDEIRVAKVKVANGHILRRAINHLYPLEVSESSQELKDDNHQATKQTSPVQLASDQGKYNLRPRRHKVLFMLAIVLATCIRGTLMETYGDATIVRRIHAQTCVSQGRVLNEMANGTICWTMINCHEGQIRRITEAIESQHCGPPCMCPSWATGCSLYEGKFAGSSNIGNVKTKRLVQENRPTFCATTPRNGCKTTAHARLLNQIELYDGTTHWVWNLHLVTQDHMHGAYECVGNQNGSQSGSERFCKQDTCHIKEASLTGCYNCDNGAELTIQCQTGFGQAIAHVSCATTSFHLDCSPQPQTQAIRLHLSQSDIDEKCQVTCPAATTSFQLKGKLFLFTTTQRIDHPTSWLGMVTGTSFVPLLRRALFGDFDSFLTTIVILFACLIITMVIRSLMCRRYRY